MSRTILERSRFDLHSSSSLQTQVDSLVGGFTEQAIDWRSLAAIMVGGTAYRVGRVGVMGLGSGNAVRAASIGLGLTAEVSAFELAHRALLASTQSLSLNPQHSNLWRWSGSGGIRQGLFQSFITFGTLKGAGHWARGENFVLQHLLQDTAMVAGHQISGALNITPRPNGSLAEQFLHAEATNLQLGAGMALAHGMMPGVRGLESGLDLAAASRGRSARPSPLRLPVGAEPVFSIALPGEIFRPPAVPAEIPLSEPPPSLPEVVREEAPELTRAPSASLRREMMSDPEKREHIRRAQAGDNTAVDALLKADHRYIVKVARRFLVQGLELSDLIQEGRLGYAHGVRKFSLEKSEREDTKVLTYVGWWVRQNITRYVADTLRTVRIPVHRQEMMRVVQKQIRALEAKGGKFGLREIAENLDLEESQVSDALNLSRWDRERSLSHRVGEDATLLDFLPDAASSPEQRVGDRIYQERLWTHLRRFGEKLSKTGRKNFEAFLMGHSPLTAPLLRRLQLYLSQNGFGPSHETYSLSPPSGTARSEIPFSSGEGRAGPITGKEFLRPKVAVIGFGAAGMTAAHYLRQPGLLTDPDMVAPQITVFEGLHRPGGKIAPDNMGAQFVDRYHFEPVTSMIERLGLSTHEVPDYDRVDFLTQDGRVLPGDDFIGALQVLRRAAGRLLTEENWQALDQRSAVDVINDLHRDRLLNEVQREAMIARLGFEEGTQNISALSFSINLLKSVSPMPRLEMKGGLYSWAEAEMAAVIAAGGEFSLNTRVDRLEVLKRGVQVYFDREGENGSEFFDFAVLALAPEHLSRVEVVGSDLPLQTFTRLQPARITKMNMLITGEFPGQEFATPRYAKWFSHEPSPALTLFSGWEGAAPLSLTEMFHAAFDAPSESALRGFEGRTWDGRTAVPSEIPHAYTTLPAPGQGYDVFQFVRQQFFSPRYDDQPLRLAGHVLGLGCYVRDAALSGEASVLSIFRSMGLAVRTGPERGRDPVREFFGVKSLPDFK